MIVLAIDPGESTGVALVDGSQVLGTWCLRMKDLGLLTTLGLQADQVVIERPPSPNRSSSQALNSVVGILTTWFPDATWIGPGLWKPIMSTKLCPDFPTPHQADAFQLSQYFQLVREAKNVIATEDREA